MPAMPRFRALILPLALATSFAAPMATAQDGPAAAVTGMAPPATPAGVPIVAAAGWPLPRDEEHITITAKNGDIGTIMARHKAFCGAMGVQVCRVESFEAEGLRYGSASIRLALNRAAFGQYVAGISGDARSYSFNLNNNGGYANGGERSPLVRRKILIAQIEALRKLEAATDVEERGQVTSQIQRLSSDLQSAERQIATEQREPAITHLTLSYSPRDNYGSNSREMKQLLSMIGLASLGALGLALLTVLYLGPLGMAFLWLRRVAVSRGLLGPARAHQETVSPATMPSSAARPPLSSSTPLTMPTDGSASSE